jgi:hypothetical protein
MEILASIEYIFFSQRHSGASFANRKGPVFLIFFPSYSARVHGRSRSPCRKLTRRSCRSRNLFAIASVVKEAIIYRKVFLQDTQTIHSDLRSSTGTWYRLLLLGSDLKRGGGVFRMKSVWTTIYTPTHSIWCLAPIGDRCSEYTDSFCM